MAKRSSKSSSVSKARGPGFMAGANGPTPDERAALEANARDIGDMPSGGNGGNGNGRGGAPSANAPGFGMLGISGLTRFGAISRVYEEFLRELQGPQGMKSYREMMDNDPIVGAILFAAQHLCRKVSFSFKPADSSNRAREVANFVGSAIFDDMESSWPDTLSEILTMLPFGWALMEFRLKRRLGMGMPQLTASPIGTPYLQIGGIGTPAPDFAPSRFDDGKTGFRSWSLRSQETLFMWEFDEDSNATHMQQMAPPDYRIRRIPLGKCLLFRTQVSKNNPEGRSVLRNAWTSYYMKKNLQIFEGIGIERDLAGYPLIQIEKPDLQKGLMVPDVWNPKNPEMVQLLAQLQKIVRSVRVDEQMGLVMPWWANFSLVNGGSRRRVDTNSIVARYDQRIAMSMMADFIMLGHEAVGSKALAATKISLFTAALSSFLDVAGAIIDRRATPILLQYNGIPMELAPTFLHGDVESINIAELGEFIAKVAGTGFNPLAGMDARKVVMQAAKLPTTDMIQGAGQDDGADGNGDGKKPGAKPGAKPKGKPATPTDNERIGDAAEGSSDTSTGPPVAAVGATQGSPSTLVEA